MYSEKSGELLHTYLTRSLE